VVAVAILLAPGLVFAGAAHKFAVGKAEVQEANTVVVPLVVTNADHLTAMDIPLQYSDGVTLEAVTFENTRTEYFDLKIANINNEDNQVIIGLLPQISAAAKPDLAAGTGVVANLVFTVDDVSVDQIDIQTFETESPGHALMFVYHEYNDGQLGQRTEFPEFEPMNVSLANLAGPNVPVSFALKQNYPNPFNPSTEISFDLPKASQVEVTIFNVLGQQVESLVNDQLDAGSHIVTWDASQYSSGVYFYRIQTDENVDTKKMMLLK
jgi:hypothetical protein